MIHAKINAPRLAVLAFLATAVVAALVTAAGNAVLPANLLTGRKVNRILYTANANGQKTRRMLKRRGTMAHPDERNKWVRLLAYITSVVTQQLLPQNEYLVAENRILRAHLPWTAIRAAAAKSAR